MTLSYVPVNKYLYFMFFWTRWVTSHQRTKGGAVPLLGFHWRLWQQDPRSGDAVSPPSAGAHCYSSHCVAPLLEIKSRVSNLCHYTLKTWNSQCQQNRWPAGLLSDLWSVLLVSLLAVSIYTLVGFKNPCCTNTIRVSSYGFAGRDEPLTQRNGTQQELHTLHSLQLLRHIQVSLLHCTQRLFVMVRLETTHKTSLPISWKYI